MRLTHGVCVGVRQTCVSVGQSVWEGTGRLLTSNAVSSRMVTVEAETLLIQREANIVPPRTICRAFYTKPIE